ncbi:hypothetical protein MBLNU230_g7150t1 [Neophaeotheca triangularis]
MNTSQNHAELPPIYCQTCWNPGHSWNQCYGTCKHCQGSHPQVRCWANLDFYDDAPSPTTRRRNVLRNYREANDREATKAAILKAEAEALEAELREPSVEETAPDSGEISMRGSFAVGDATTPDDNAAPRETTIPQSITTAGAIATAAPIPTSAQPKSEQSWLLKALGAKDWTEIIPGFLDLDREMRKRTKRIVHLEALGRRPLLPDSPLRKALSERGLTLEEVQRAKSGQSGQSGWIG